MTARRTRWRFPSFSAGCTDRPPIPKRPAGPPPRGALPFPQRHGVPAMNQTIRARIHDSAVRARHQDLRIHPLRRVPGSTPEQPPRRRHARAHFGRGTDRECRRPRHWGRRDAAYRHRRRRRRGHRRSRRPAELRRERLAGRPGPARGRRRLRLRQPVAPRLHRLLAAPSAGRPDRARLDRRPGAQALSSAKPRQRSAPTTAPRSRTAPRFRSARPSPPPRCATRQRAPPGIIRCP